MFLINYFFCPPENTCSEKYSPSELYSQGLLVWRTWKLRFWGESEENGGQVEPSEEAVKKLGMWSNVSKSVFKGESLLF